MYGNYNNCGSDQSNSTTMEASAAFETLLQHIIESNLNFKLELSPFSAVISLKKSFVRDKYGKTLPPMPTNAVFHHHIKEENQDLKTKIQSMENVIERMKANYENAIDDCEEAHAMKTKLEMEMENLKPRLLNVKEETSDRDNEFEALESKCFVMENELAVNRRELENVIEHNKNYKTEIKNINTKMRK
jgi:hypothetical protein